MNTARFITVCLLLVTAGGCASSGSVESVRRDMDESKNRIYTLERDLVSAREGEKHFKDNFASLRKSDADMQANLDILKGDIRNISGRSEELLTTFRRYQEDSDRRITALEDRIVKLQVTIEELKKQRLEQNSNDATTPDALYLKGLESFKAGDMPSARTLLTTFLEKHGDHELASNARYWIGETYYGEKNYEQAILEFQEVVKHYPKKEKAPAAMLKQALAFKAIKDQKSSQYLLKRLITDYPKSEEAKKAKQLLK